LKRDKIKKGKEWKKRRAQMNEELRTRSFYVRKLQSLVNEFVRIRDNGKECISCETILNADIKKFDAGHFFSAGHYPETRFNLDNIFGQCVECNRYKGGNLHEYRKKLIQRIGEERFRELELLTNQKSDLNKSDLKDMIEEFKLKLNKVKNEIRSDNN
jgi:5-methylcytosine-specific restriction endonuclease McrA